MSFQVGDKVFWSEYEVALKDLNIIQINELYYGIIKFLSDKEAGVVEYYSQRLNSLNLSHLYSEEDVKSKKSVLQQEYEKVQQEVKEKIAAGVALIKEAEAKLNASGLNLINNYDLSRPVRSMIDNLGWNSSSLSC